MRYTWSVSKGSTVDLFIRVTKSSITLTHDVSRCQITPLCSLLPHTLPSLQHITPPPTIQIPRTTAMASKPLPLDLCPPLRLPSPTHERLPRPIRHRCPPRARRAKLHRPASAEGYLCLTTTRCERQSHWPIGEEPCLVPTSIQRRPILNHGLQ